MKNPVTAERSIEQKDLHRAYCFWKPAYEYAYLDDLLKPFLSTDASAFPPEGSWLKSMRLALFISTGEMAKRLKISRGAYCNLEKREKDGTISLVTLEKSAKAMGCELVYCLRPISRVAPSKIIWNYLAAKATALAFNRRRSNPVPGNIIGIIAREMMRNNELRKTYRWTERKNTRSDY